ncbi:hypothetical protein COV24_04435 [candidate division WWE3 bacterium CG10_big_fil_rev_8_21_14_0_10_32_10]|uniref:Uncharacterized protein n=1 Tax=candidate division WWE3 bacterium CG10_big_fil_rev_8_21_14_0_10_32_10 TaxID=1975090 RepID=A0A2H0RBB5_UNCKA|nr:MAG: hypothetical protein COV24_04435 [candidate division WWE3 bacterium CG10_big_fil_rev_8_21_14_0_10_32_10]
MYLKPKIHNIKDIKNLKRYKNIYYLGNIDLLNSLCFTIVGSRKITQYGISVVEDIVYKMCKNNIVTVSGFVEGVDYHVFKETLKNKGNHIICLGYGFDHFFKNIYPQFVKDLRLFFKNDLLTDLSNILILSQFEFGLPPSKWTFPKRDELLASVGKGVLVVEAAKKSGTFYTVKRAFKENKPVYAVPGNIFSPQSAGCHFLIKEGFKKNRALLYSDFTQLINYFGVNNKQDNLKNKKIMVFDKVESTILNVLSAEPIHFDDILVSVKLNSSKLNILLTKLEIKGLVRRVNGSYFVRKY